MTDRGPGVTEAHGADDSATGLRGATAVLCCCASLLATGTAAADPHAVVELFTSQGCSSCPPADETLTRLAADPDVLGLSFPVDYWDYLGWKDTFAKADFTRRQRAYADARGSHAVYTPQAVINGRVDVVGSDEAAIRASIKDLTGRGQGLTVDIDAHLEGDRIVVTVPAGQLPASGHAAVWIASLRAPETVKIGRGENSGKAITYTNIVERLQVLGMWDGQPMTVELPMSDIAQDNSAGFAVILQSKDNRKPGPIIGAATIDLGIN